MRPVNVVVVDFPFVPVIATMRPVSQRDASSISPMTGTPASRAAAICGWSSGTPGLSTSKSADVNVSSRCAPSSSATPCVAQLIRLGRLELGPGVGQRHARAALGEQQRGGDAAARRADHRHVLSPHREAHRSFNVVRLKSAKMIATIRNRVITFGSLQPINSKW